MIILTRKKIIYTLSIIIICICTYIFTAYNIAYNVKNEIKTIQTVALPVENKIIVVDAGHGIPDQGAESSKRDNRSRK